MPVTPPALPPPRAPPSGGAPCDPEAGKPVVADWGPVGSGWEGESPGRPGAGGDPLRSGMLREGTRTGGGVGGGRVEDEGACERGCGGDAWGERTCEGSGCGFADER